MSRESRSTLTRRIFMNASAAALVTAMHGPLCGTARAQAANVAPEKRALIQRLRLSSNDLDAQEPFYRDILEFPTERTNENTLVVTTGQSIVEFIHEETTVAPFYHIAFTIPENRVEQALEWMTPRSEVLAINARGEKIMNFAHWNAHSIFYLDPVGNILEFIGHHELKNATSDPFNPNQVLYTSEIGLVVPDVPSTVDSLNKHFGYENFRGLSSKNFTAVGDMRGLLLIVQEGRGWLPINTVKSAVFPVEATVGLGGGTGTMEIEGLPYTIKRA